MSGYDMAIHESTSAAKWAEFFIETRNKTNFEIDESLMIGWFANAMMAMHDHVCREKDQEITKLEKALELANTQLAILLENAECREDEDCDHCMAIGAQKQIKEIMESK